MRIKKVTVQWVIIMVNGSRGEFVTGDLRPCWGTRRAAQKALKERKGENGADKDYIIAKFVRQSR